MKLILLTVAIVACVYAGISNAAEPASVGGRFWYPQSVDVFVKSGESRADISSSLWYGGFGSVSAGEGRSIILSYMQGDLTGTFYDGYRGRTIEAETTASQFDLGLAFAGGGYVGYRSQKSFALVEKDDRRGMYNEVEEGSLHVVIGGWGASSKRPGMGLFGGIYAGLGGTSLGEGEVAFLLSGEGGIQYTISTDSVSYVMRAGVFGSMSTAYTLFTPSISLALAF